MSTFHPRRAVGLAGLLSAAGLLVALKAGAAPPPKPVSLPATQLPGPATPGAGTAPAPAGRRSLLGSPEDVGYGIVQVRVTLNGSRIVDATSVQMPDGGRSGDITSYSGPKLRAEVLAAQSAHIDTVSGASYTSQGYAASVQSALDAAHR